jgi:hypothetical protein
VLISDLSFNNLIHAAKASINAIAVEGRPKRYILALLSEAQRLYELRNRAVHGRWFATTNKDTFLVLRHRARGKLVRQADTFTLQELDEIARGLSKMLHRIDRFQQFRFFSSRSMFVRCSECGHQH